MRLSKNVLLIAIVMVSAVLSGCILVPIAGFGYTGYQYHEKEGVFAPGQPLGGPAAADKDKKSSDSNPNAQPAPAPNNHDIE